MFLVIALKQWDLSVAVNAGMTSEVLSSVVIVIKPAES